MKININILNEFKACEEGKEEFLKHFQNDEADYQEVLDKCVDLGFLNFAEWLVLKMPATNDTVEVDEIISDGSVFFAGNVKVKNYVRVNGCVYVGGSIDVGGRIYVEGGIIAGKSIKSKGKIKAARDIFANGYIKSLSSIKSSKNIKAGEHIEASKHIKAGKHIEAGGHIKAGENFCIFAGVPVSKKIWH